MSAHIRVLQSVMYICGFNHRLFMALGDGLIFKTLCVLLFVFSIKRDYSAKCKYSGRAACVP